MRTKTIKTEVYKFDKKYGQKTRRRIDRFFTVGFKSPIIARILKNGFEVDICRQDIDYWNRLGIFNYKDEKLCE
jgi:hypothetical protein